MDSVIAPPGAGSLADPLRLLDLVGDLNAVDDAQSFLDDLAAATAGLAGYRIAMISLALPDANLIGAHALPPETVERFRRTMAETTLESRRQKRDRIRELVFAGTRIAFVPAETPLARSAAFRTSAPGADGWRPEDRLFVLMRGSGGEDIGVASLDEPLDGRRPSADRLDALRLAERLLEIGAAMLEARLLHLELRRRDELLQRISDSVADAIVVVEPTARVAFSSASWRRLAGDDAADLLCGARPGDREALAQLVADCIANRRNGLREIHFTGAGSEERVLEAQVSPVLTAAGGCREAVVVLRDITDQLAATRALQERETLFRSLADHAADAFFLHDAEGLLLDVNQHACESLGYERDELIGRSIREIEMNFEHSVLADVWATLEPGRPVTLEGMHRRRDGTLFPVEVRVVRCRSADSDVFLALARDVTERRAAETALRDSEERYRCLVDGSPDAILLHQGGRIVFANQASARVLGRQSAEELVGVPVLDLVDARDLDLVTSRMRRLARGDRVPHVELRLRRADGVAVEVESIAIPAVHRGQPAVQSIFRDIRERRQLEEQLRHSQKLEAVGRLAGGVAHDFNNLLTVISGFGRLIRERLGPDAEAAKYVTRVLEASQRATALTQQLLLFGRRHACAPQVIDPNAHIRSTYEMASRLVGPDVVFETKLDPDVGCVRVDPNHLSQVLMNLVINARDAMPEGGRLTIATSRASVDEGPGAAVLDAPPGVYVVVTVADTGVGMDADTIARAFEPFFTTKDPGKGTGLGLPTVFGIVKQAGGAVSLRSTIGRGTEVRVFLPRFEGLPLTEPSSDEEPAAPTVLAPRSILVVDDEEPIRELLREILEADGHRVETAAGGDEALLAVADPAIPFDLLLTDVAMPGMDGRVLAERFAELRPGVPVLFVSGYLGAGVGGHVTLPPGANFLPKPFVPRDLLEKIAEILPPPDRE